jgi:toxin ParE1/3/4
MLKLRLSRAAQQHLEDIWLYTISEWGEDQAEKYVALIEKALSLLPDNPYHGKVRPDVKPGYRALQAGKHLIFYSVGEEFVDVIGILHIRVVPERQLDDR